jgi:hypothetical protein
LEAQEFENFYGMVNKALVLENHRGVMERKHKLVCQHQSGSSFRPHVATSLARPVCSSYSAIVLAEAMSCLGSF